MWIVSIVIASLLCHVTTPTPVIVAPWGSIQGVEVEGRGGRKMNAYLGIPFAQPPTGNLRWKKPEAHPGLEKGEVFLADTYKPACPQDLMLGVTAGTSEDCLTLDVYVPTTVTSPRPVMVFIHGGGLGFGESASYRPFKLVADGDVIVVAIQYRLGTLGFLSTGDDTLPGNYGLWDQTLALKWVKANIRAFQGDPDMVTLFGESAGGWSTGLQMVSPYSRGLFHRAILQSGTAQTAVNLGALEYPFFKGVSRKLGCEKDSDQEALECMRLQSAEDVLNKTSEWMQETGEMTQACARVDGDFIPRDPAELLHDEQYMQDKTSARDIDIIVGFNNKEGAMFTFAAEISGSPMQGFTDALVYETVLAFAVKIFNDRQPDDLLNKVVDFFYRGADMGSNSSVPLDAMVDLAGDAWFYAHSVEFLRSLVSQPHTGARFLYMLEHDFNYNSHRIRGAHHGDELFLEFDLHFPENSMLSMLNKTFDLFSADDEKMSGVFVDMVTTFAKTGNPSPAVKTALGGDWPEFTTEDEAYLSLALSPRVQRDIFRDRIALWLKLLPRIRAKRRQEPATPAGKARDEL